MDQFDRVYMTNLIGHCHMKQNDYHEAITQFEKALSIYDKQKGFDEDNEHIDLFNDILDCLATCYYSIQMYSNALLYYQKCLNAQNQGEQKKDLLHG